MTTIANLLITPVVSLNNRFKGRFASSALPSTESMTKNNSPIYLPPFPHGRAEANTFLRVMSENLGVMSK